MVMPSALASGLTAEQDWANRKAAGGVTVFDDFRDGTLFANRIFPNSDQGYVSRDTSQFVTGNACCLTDVPSTAGGGAPAYIIHWDPTKTLNSQGIGTSDFYVQMLMKLGPNRLTPSNGGGGFKTFILGGYDVQGGITNSNSHTDNEFVVSTYNWKIPSPYFETGSGTPPLWEANGGGGDLFMQPGGDHACTYNKIQTSDYSGCILWPVNQLFVLYYRVRYAAMGGTTGNQMDLYMQLPGETTYRQIFASRDFALGNDVVKYTGGPNGLWLTPYDTSRIDSSVNTWHRYYQVIMSRNPIAPVLAPVLV